MNIHSLEVEESLAGSRSSYLKFILFLFLFFLGEVRTTAKGVDGDLGY